jgi:hypothetical protein
MLVAGGEVTALRLVARYAFAPTLALACAVGETPGTGTGGASFGGTVTVGTSMTGADTSGTGDTGGNDSATSTEGGPGADETSDTNDTAAEAGTMCTEGLTMPCYTGPDDTREIGACTDGVQHCDNGLWSGTCENEVLPQAEVCDGEDNDCNGMTDDGDLEGGACRTGMPGVCADGTSSCEGGRAVCTPDTASSNETCDGQDNDCDGMTDDGLGGAACNTGQSGVCSAGTETCAGGSMVCTQNQQASNEQCGDGLDNDCNGTVDNGCGPVCGQNGCEAGEDSCTCPGDCPDDPNSCSSCQCNGSGGSCWCDSACVGFGDCCGNACAVCGYC